MTKIAVLGTGRMGSSIALRLLAVGYRVSVWNRTTSRAGPAVQAGARMATSPADAVRDAEIVITMLADATAVNAVLFGPGGAVSALTPEACLVEMSTIGPTAVRDLAGRLPEGVELVDAPVGGSVAAAEAGHLLVLAGGAARTVERVAPVLRTLGTVRHCGVTGCGAAMKLVLNTALVTAITGLADTVAVARAVGVDLADALDVLASSALAGAVRRATATGASFSVALAAKDLDLALVELGRKPAPVARAAAQGLRGTVDPTADIGVLVTKEHSWN
ncbi:NAD(P)-dependent oxidoreductase [Micromonospora sp. IBHARD004]|uniref:NAD(P)-dependent oxidoreductase n=1 Tax=Micromonospora sp. IBHARD004 TaxID=3457764 RepID=UPI00405842F6